ncbi:SMI1/KNR4 family protein [Nonomuraea sp. M3C6]|uniref:SMI1/KNR4 family protein n=1 Tax=Nonomuraea marmarensis TaxID=3351344 RepID=A0ABW7A307_9ACTN
MLKLVRLALTAAILTAIVVRLRRRARLPAREPAHPAPRPARSTRMGLVWAAIAAIVAVTLAAAVIPTETQEAEAAAWRTYQAEQDALTAELLKQQSETSEGSQASTPGPAPTGSAAAWTPAPVPTGLEPEIPDPNCSPALRPVTVRPIGPKVRRAVDRQWRRIERWLKANAPRTYRTLGAPGRARTIAVAESQMGVDFPDDLRASLLRHNGSRGTWASRFGFWFGGAANLGTREIRDTWRWMCSWERADYGTDPSIEYWNGRMIPFLAFAERDNEDMPYAVVDSAGGAVGWDDTISGMAPRKPSYYALMRAVADALEQGTEIDGWRPAVKRGVLRWETP